MRIAANQTLAAESRTAPFAVSLIAELDEQ
jgi:hypothetical protein